MLTRLQVNLLLYIVVLVDKIFGIDDAVIKLHIDNDYKRSEE